MASLAASPSFKVCMLGDMNAGKSMMIECLKYGGVQVPENAFPRNTISCDLYSHEIRMQGKNITLQIWDTAGQERFRSMAHFSMRDARVVLLVYDITDCTSFQSITDWFLLAKEHVHPNAIFVLVGNKMDLHGHRGVTQGIAHTLLAHEWDYFETSALYGQNILFLFDQIAKELVRPNIDVTNVTHETDTVILVDSSHEEVRGPSVAVKEELDKY